MLVFYTNGGANVVTAGGVKLSSKGFCWFWQIMTALFDLSVLECAGGGDFWNAKYWETLAAITLVSPWTIPFQSFVAL